MATSPSWSGSLLERFLVQRLDDLGEGETEVEALSRSSAKVFQAPPVEWIKDRLENLQEVLQNRIARSAKALRDLLGPIRLDLVAPDIGRPFYRAVTTLDALALIEPPPGAEGGSNSFHKWTRTQRIRTAAAIPLVVSIVDAGSIPMFLQIGAKAAHLRELGLSDRAIASALGVSDKTVAKSISAGEGALRSTGEPR